MDKFIIDGGNKLYGTVNLQRAKNTVLPILAASILTDEQVKIRGVPPIVDVENMLRILTELGCKVTRQKDYTVIDSSNAVSHEIPSSLTKELRSSVFMLGSVLARFHRAKISYPGGCDIGLRPIDLHLLGLKRLGVEITEEGVQQSFNNTVCDHFTKSYASLTCAELEPCPCTIYTVILAVTAYIDPSSTAILCLQSYHNAFKSK